MADANITHLCPSLQVLYREWLMRCNAAGLSVRATVTWRNDIDQNTAKANGLSDAAAGESPHNCCTLAGAPFSKAFDFGVFDGGEYITDGMDDRYRQAGEIGKTLGLEYGGDWRKPDWDHLELKDWRQNL